MQFDDGRRTYYDHEGPYRRIAAKGGAGWDALSGDASNDSYAAVEEFLSSPFAAFLGAGQTVLDLGCGGGQVALMLAKRGCVTHGIDFSPTAISIAKANAAKVGLSIEFREGDCLTLAAYADRSMDMVADNHAWHCIVDQQDRRAFLQAAYRVLKNGGLIFSEMMTREGDFSPSVVDADPRTFIARHHNRYWVGREEALDELKSTGFEILHERLKPQMDAPGVGSLLIVYARRL
jgi:ubiquinone/menaquinone biosynthesis C-methylase UbiE